MKINLITHPEYDSTELEWKKWRYAYEGGRNFVRTYLKKFSTREDTTDFEDRMSITYCPRFAGAAIDDIKNSIYQRIADVSRTGGSVSYQDAIKGLDGGIDLKGNSMDSFIGCQILPELLPMGKVGIYVDKPSIPDGSTLRDTRNLRPYLYKYRCEDIRSWIVDPTNPDEFEALLLRDFTLEIDEDTGFPVDTVTRFRYYKKTPFGVLVQIYNDEGDATSETMMLDLPRIPFVMVELSYPLMSDIADYQIALLNLDSSDLGYVLKSNFPFYVEQYHPNSLGSGYLKPPGNEDVDTPGSESTAPFAKIREVKVGTTHGRAYPVGTDQPGFINPSTEPIEASMKKQNQIKEEIRLLLNLAISNLRPQKASSAESKSFDERGLESGLSYIGLALESAERQIAEIWGYYENQKPATIFYPKEYSLKSDAERRSEAKDQLELRDSITSETFRKEVTKKAAKTLLSGTISKENMDKVYNEIDKAKGFSANYEIIRDDVESGLVSKETASLLRGYPEGEAEKAKEEHAERVKALAGSQMPNGAARGVDDLDANPNSGSEEKELSRETDLEEETDDRTRGTAK